MTACQCVKAGSMRNRFITQSRVAAVDKLLVEFPWLIKGQRRVR